MNKFVGDGLFVKNFKLAFELDEQRLAFSIECFASRHFDPALAETILLHVFAFFAIETNANVVLKNFGLVKGAARIDGEVIGQFGAGGCVTHISGI